MGRRIAVSGRNGRFWWSRGRRFAANRFVGSGLGRGRSGIWRMTICRVVIVVSRMRSAMLPSAINGMLVKSGFGRRFGDCVGGD